MRRFTWLASVLFLPSAFAATALPAAAECRMPPADAPADDSPSCQSDGKAEKPVQQPKDDKPAQPSAGQPARYIRITKPRAFSGGMPSAALRVRYELEDDPE